MFDERSFSTDSFSTDSWLFGLVAAVRRQVVRLASRVMRVVELVSRV